MTRPSATSQVGGGGPVPKGNLAGLRRYGKHDLLAGFLVSLIALPLCLGISLASGYPAVAGIFTAIIGGVLGCVFSNSELTIKGPAAGLIVIALGAIQELGQGNNAHGYQLALGIGVVAGIVQIAFGLFRTGVLGEFFPTSAVHGMLAAIGIIIASKQLHVMLGVVPTGKGPLALIAELPHSALNLNPEIAVIGIGGLCLLFGMPRIRHPLIRFIPAPMVVLVAAVVTGAAFDLSHEHTYLFGVSQYHLGPEYLVSVPRNLANAITFPDFSAVATATGIKYVVMFALVGSLESLLSAKAIDRLDPWQRRTTLDRDLIAIGVGNTLASFVGGLPMISEIVRSSANINNGARTRFANAFHGVFLLGFVVLLPSIIARVPYAALGAMLVYTGVRLASPSEFVATFRVGRDQLVIFITTIVVTLATDLLIGIGAGIFIKFGLHVMAGVPLGALFRARTEKTLDESGASRLSVKDAAIFSNWISLKRRIQALDPERDVIVDLSETRLVDHTVMTKLDELSREFTRAHRELRVIGLEEHECRSGHPHAARRRVLGVEI